MYVNKVLTLGASKASIGIINYGAFFTDQFKISKGAERREGCKKILVR